MKNDSFNDNGFGSLQNKSNEADVKAINDRANNFDNYGRRASDEEEPSKGESGRVRESDLKKDGLESSDDKKGSDKKSDLNDKDDKKDDKKSDKSGGKGSKIGGLLQSEIGSKIQKYKMYAIVAGIAIVIFLFIFTFSLIASLFNSLTNAITNFFGISEENQQISTTDGLYTNDDYLIDPNTGKEIEHDDLINKLKGQDENTCKSTLFTDIADWITGPGFNGDVCKFLRYMRNLRDKDKVDSALIIASIFYGYDTKPRAEQYEDPESVSENETLASEHFTSLKEVLSSTNMYDIKKWDVDDLATYSQATSTTIYYTWTIEETTDDEGNLLKKTGKCTRMVHRETKHNLDKWLSFMRFGAEVADMFDDEVLTILSYDSTDDECQNADVYTDEALLEMVKQGTPEGVEVEVEYGGVHKAREEFKEYEKRQRDATAFYQSADINSKTKDVFKSYKGVVFDYRNGFAYNKFPGYRWAINNSNVKIYWDDIFTPKEVETTIQYIVDKKKDINSVLNLDDYDVLENAEVKGVHDGNVEGQNCGEYLTHPYSAIKVTLTDCNGNYYDTVTLEDYIIGVATGEVSNRNPDYVKSEMLAALSYALRRRNNYQHLPTIRMRSGNCDQVYCNPNKGCTPLKDVVPGCSACHSYKIGGKMHYYPCTGSGPCIYTLYQSYYADVSQYLVVSDGKPHNCHYVDTIQRRWYAKSVEGKPFTQIIQEEYESEGAKVIRCSDQNPVASDSDDDEDAPPEKVGNTPSDDYPEVSSDKGKYYGFAFKSGDGTNISIDPKWKEANIVTISPSCSDTEFSNMKFKVNKQAEKKFTKAFEGVCKLLTDGVKISNGSTCKYTASDLNDGTVFIERKTANGSADLHAYGIAQDWNYSKTYTIDGKNYTPYNTRELQDYLDFVQAIGGNEENCKNVNYILWKYAYKDAGFLWGGNYGRNGNNGTYDGKLFVINYE